MVNQLVSIIMPVHNSALFIGSSIDSVISQTYSDWELLVVDDASSDDSVNLVKEYIQRDNRIKLIKSAKNIGPAHARNLAIMQSRGRFLAFLDSDDIWLPNKLDKQISFMIKNGYPFTYTAYEKIDRDNNFLGRIGVPENVDYKNLLKTCSIGCLTAIYDVGFYGKVQMPTKTRREDYATWLALLKRGRCANGITEVLAQYRVHKNQSSSKKLNMAIENWKLYREIEELSLIKAMYYFSHYAIRGLLRTKTPSFARLIGVLH